MTLLDGDTEEGDERQSEGLLGCRKQDWMNTGLSCAGRVPLLGRAHSYRGVCACACVSSAPAGGELSQGFMAAPGLCSQEAAGDLRKQVLWKGQDPVCLLCALELTQMLPWRQVGQFKQRPHK